MKKTLALILLGVMIGSTVTFATSKIFPDVPANEWYANAVNSLSSKGIIGGYPDGTFGPSKNVNRAELAVMIDKTIQYITMSNLTATQKSAWEKCESLGGNPRTAISEESGANEVFCKFAEGECTQNELNESACYKEKA